MLKFQITFPPELNVCRYVAVNLFPHQHNMTGGTKGVALLAATHREIQKQALSPLLLERPVYPHVVVLLPVCVSQGW